MRRFYKAASALAADDGWTVALDGKPIRTPAGRKVLLPVPEVAQAIAEEWAAQPTTGEIIVPSMPLTRLAATGIDRVGPQREKVIDDTARYGGSDLVCYRASAPADLAARQSAAWQPALDWAVARYGAPLALGFGVSFVDQPAASLAALRAAVARHGNLALSALFNLTASTGSLVLALAVSEGRLTAAEAFEAAEVDALHQAEKWGEDAEAVARRAGIRADIAACARFLGLLGPARLLSG